MSLESCAEPIPLFELIDYLAGDLESPDEGRVEEHFFGCERCAMRLEEVERLGAAIAEVVRSGRVTAVVTESLLDHAESEGLKLRQYRIEPGDSILCTAAPDDDFVVVRLSADFGEVADVSVEVDTLFLPTDTHELKQVRDVTIDRTKNEILLLFPGGIVRSFPRSQWTMYVSGKQPDGERSFGPYVMNHTPWEELSSPS